MRSPVCTAVRLRYSADGEPGADRVRHGQRCELKATAAAAPNEPGFGLYLKGRIFMFELTGGALPAAGTVWTMRDYTGVIYGGNGTAATGAYAFVPADPPDDAPRHRRSSSRSMWPTRWSAIDQRQRSPRCTRCPDPYYVTSAFDLAVDAKDIQFVNVPIGATIRIYTTSGVLVRVLQNTSTIARRHRALGRA